jgi:hypothetical protein
MVVLGKNTVGVTTGVFIGVGVGGNTDINGPRKEPVVVIVVTRDGILGIMPADCIRIIGCAVGRMAIGGGRPPARAVVPAAKSRMDVLESKSPVRTKKCVMVVTSSEEKAADRRASSVVRLWYLLAPRNLAAIVHVFRSVQQDGCSVVLRSAKRNWLTKAGAGRFAGETRDTLGVFDDKHAVIAICLHFVCVCQRQSLRD